MAIVVVVYGKKEEINVWTNERMMKNDVEWKRWKENQRINTRSTTCTRIQYEKKNEMVNWTMTTIVTKRW